MKPNKRLFMDFNMDKERLDDFFMKFLNGVNRFSKIAEVVKFVLTLSHGQTAVERDSAYQRRHCLKILEMII